MKRFVFTEKHETQFNRARTFVAINYLLFFGFLFVLFSESQICSQGKSAVTGVLIFGIAALLFSIFTVVYTVRMASQQQRGPDLVIGSGLAFLLLAPPVLFQLIALPHC